MGRFVGAKAIAAFAFMLKANWSGTTAVSRKHQIVRNGQSSLCRSYGSTFGPEAFAGLFFPHYQALSATAIICSSIQSWRKACYLLPPTGRCQSVSLSNHCHAVSLYSVIAYKGH